MVALVKPDNRILDTIIQGDCLDVLRTLDTCSVDAIVTDPPAGISFMGKDWDANKGSRDIWITWLSQIMAECLRVLKPGGHALIWALPRTSHWTATAIEDAGFEIRDVLTHLFGSGFPKSMDISKAIDKMQGAEREIVGQREYADGTKGHATNNMHQGYQRPCYNNPAKLIKYDTAPATPEAQQWQGYGTALKPANEHWILARKPLSEKSIAANVLKWGTGGLNIDASRIACIDKTKFPVGQSKATKAIYAQDDYSKSWKSTEDTHPQGRFPSNLLLSHSLFCVPLGMRKVKGTAPHGRPTLGQTQPAHVTWGLSQRSSVHYADSEGMEEVQAWECTPDCPIRLLDEQSGIRKSGTGAIKQRTSAGHQGSVYGKENRPLGTPNIEYGDQGGASRYFTQFCYTAKASKRERGENNTHPTVKSLSLMSWLCRLITPPNGIVLDCFAGSGSTLVACVQEGFHFIGIEQSAEYIEIARCRVAYAMQGVTL